MPCKDPVRRGVYSRGATRSGRHGNWRQTYIDCAGVCVARNGSGGVCGEVEGLEFHEIFGENGHRNDPKFQIRVLLCNHHHSLIEDRTHQSYFISSCYRHSVLGADVQREIEYAGGYDRWIARWNLDDSRAGCLLDRGPYVDDAG